MERDINKLIIFLKEKGFIYQSSIIYGGMANSWDFGPLGTILRDNIRQVWKNHFVIGKGNVFPFESTLITNQKIWKSSGHLDRFNDPIIECKNCSTRYRADHLLEQNNLKASGLSNEEIEKLILKNSILCPKCKEKTKWGNVKNFELMFKTSLSKTTEGDEVAYLRPETAQGIFTNFKNVVNNLNPKLPFAISQIGKAFRNEVTPGNYIFRTKEFEQLELEYFVDPKNWKPKFNSILKDIDSFLNKIGLNKDNLKKKDIDKKSLAHYSIKTIDYEYNFSFGWGELLGLANRTDFDLKNHSKFSGEDLSYRDPITNTKFFPYVLEASFGLDRLMLAILTEGFSFQQEEREVLKIPFAIAPYKLAIAPLGDEHIDFSKKLLKKLNKKINDFIKIDITGSIGKRYVRNDAIGTPFVITVDNQSLQDNTVTIRNRDTKSQDRIKISQIQKYIYKNAI